MKLSRQHKFASIRVFTLTLYIILLREQFARECTVNLSDWGKHFLLHPDGDQ